jgi:NAD+ kinase
MKKIGIFVKSDSRACRKADAFEKWLEDKGVAVVRRLNPPLANMENDSHEERAPGDLDCVFVLGGDGTFLSAARWIDDREIPMIGVKFGEIGFLAEVAEDKLFTIAESILEDQYATTQRMRLMVQVFREGDAVATETVMNDVVINKGALARLADMTTYIDDHYLTTYRADGLIVATPTGSTAYSLAAGGPVIHPVVPGIVMTPISPFTLTNRPLIVPDSVVIRVGPAGTSDMMLTFDGQKGMDIRNGDTIVIRKGSCPVRMISIPDQHYFDVLKAKLSWSGGRS